MNNDKDVIENDSLDNLERVKTLSPGMMVVKRFFRNKLAIVGLVIFFLLWENRSRYIFNYIPIFILIIVEFYNNFKEKLWNKKSFKV